MRDREEIYKELTEEEKQAYDLFIDWNLQGYAEEVLREHEKREKNNEERRRKLRPG